MENMDKGLTVPKLGADSLAENTQIAENLSAQFVCPSPKVLDFNEKRLHWASVVLAQCYAAMKETREKCDFSKETI